MLETLSVPQLSTTERETFTRMSIGYRAEFNTSLTFEDYQRLKESANLLGLDPLVNTYIEIRDRQNRIK